MDELSGNLSQLSGQADDIRRNLNFRIAGREQIAARLREVSERISREADAARSMGRGLEQAVAWYERTEQANLGRVAAQAAAIQGGASGGAGNGAEKSGYQYVPWEKKPLDYVIRQLSNLIGPFGFVLTEGRKALEGGDPYANVSLWNSVLKSLGKVVSKIPDQLSKTTPSAWMKELFGYAPGKAKKFWDSFKGKIGDFSKPAKALGTVVTWATAFFDRAVSNLKEMDKGGMGLGRFWGETVVETGLKVGATALIGAGVAAAMGAAPAVAVGAVTVAVTMGVDWALNNIVSWITKGEKTDWIDAFGDGIIDGGKWLVDKAGQVTKKAATAVADAAKSGVNAVKNAGAQIADKIGKGVSKVKEGVSNLFSGCRWGALCFGN